MASSSRPAATCTNRFTQVLRLARLIHTEVLDMPAWVPVSSQRHAASSCEAHMAHRPEKLSLA